jgi:ParB family chromosome partitioning protein
MVTKKPKGLGLGLEALLGPTVSEGSGDSGRQPTTLKLVQLQPGKYQPRTRMDEGSLYELAESIKSQGIMQPVLVREVSDETAAVMALIENMQREDLNPLEQAQGLQRLVTEFKLTHEQAAQAVGRSRSAASNLLRLLNLVAPVQQMLMAGDLEMGHARALLSLDAAQQILAAGTVAAKKLSVRETEKLVAKTLSAGRQAPLLRIKKEKSRDIVRLEEQLADRLAAAVEIRVRRKTPRGEQGEIAISFGSLEELNGLLEKLGAADA